MSYLVDSSAWVSYFNGSDAGKEVDSIINSKNKIYIISPIISEVISFAKRNKIDCDLVYEVLLKCSELIPISNTAAKKAGLFHAQKRLADVNFPLVDALILAVADESGLKIITKDSHFKSFKNVLLLK